MSQGGNCTRSNDPSAQKCQSAAEQYWEKFVLKVDQAPTYIAEDGNVTAFPSFGEIGEIKWDLSICLLASWIIGQAPSHVFTIPESTNLFHEIFLGFFSTR